VYSGLNKFTTSAVRRLRIDEVKAGVNEKVAMKISGRIKENGGSTVQKPRIRVAQYLKA
jgi:hypothetical protein